MATFAAGGARSRRREKSLAIRASSLPISRSRWVALFVQHIDLPEETDARRAPRVDRRRRHLRDLSSLEGLAEDRRDRPDRGDRPARLDPRRRRGAGRKTVAEQQVTSRSRQPLLADRRPPCLRLHPRPAGRRLVDCAQKRARQAQSFVLKASPYPRLSSRSPVVRPAGIWRRDRTLTTALRFEGARRRAPPFAPARRDLAAADALKVVLTSLDDAKAEDLISIDITGKSSLGDYMVVASGRSRPTRRCHRRTAGHRPEGGRLRGHPRRGPAQLRLGPGRCRRCHRPYLPAGSPELLQYREDVARRSSGSAGSGLSGPGAAAATVRP